MLPRRTSARTRKSRERMLHLRVNSPRIVFLDCLKVGSRLVKIGAAVLLMVGVGIGLGYGWQKVFVENEEFEIADSFRRLGSIWVKRFLPSILMNFRLQ